MLPRGVRMRLIHIWRNSAIATTSSRPAVRACSARVPQHPVGLAKLAEGEKFLGDLEPGREMPVVLDRDALLQRLQDLDGGEARLPVEAEMAGDPGIGPVEI